jgi:hypothetical protein
MKGGETARDLAHLFAAFDKKRLIACPPVSSFAAEA